MRLGVTKRGKKKEKKCTHFSVCNEVLDFSASANDCAPMSSISLQLRQKEDAESGWGGG